MIFIIKKVSDVDLSPSESPNADEDKYKRIKKE